LRTIPPGVAKRATVRAKLYRHLDAAGEANDVLAVREPGGRRGGQRDEAAVIRLGELAGRAARRPERALTT